MNLVFRRLPPLLLLSRSSLAYKSSQEEADVAEGEEDDLESTVEIDEIISSDANEADLTVEEMMEDEEEIDQPLKPSPDAETIILFIRPTSLDFPAGHQVKFLVGFTNKGKVDFIVDSMDAAFRYPQDYSFYIQNFSSYRYHRLVEPNHETTFQYYFIPSETFSARPFGLTVNLNYRDVEGRLFQDAIFNATINVTEPDEGLDGETARPFGLTVNLNYRDVEGRLFQDAIFNATINVTEPDEGLDGETFFLYLFLAAILVLLVVGTHQLLTTYGKLRFKSRPKSSIEMGTQNNRTDVDYEWLPKKTLQFLSKSPKQTAKSKTSPHHRMTKRRSGNTEN